MGNGDDVTGENEGLEASRFALRLASLYSDAMIANM